MNHITLYARKTGTLVLSLLLLVVVGVAATFAQTKRNQAAKEFMREKLELSQRVLEGLATEDYDLIIAKGTRLSAMSKEVDWRVFENPDYDQQSILFRRQVDSLVRAAKNKNLDAATLAYVRMTMSCVDCHKLVRGKLVASVGGLPRTAPASHLWLDLSASASRQETASSQQALHTMPVAIRHLGSEDL